MELEQTQQSDWIKDSNTEKFMDDVIQASMQTPVIVDFWAPWCGPCKDLGPTLERVVQGAGGAVRLVKINVDENQQLAQQLRVQSIPAVFAFKDGQPVDAFMGALPESQIKQFVENLGAAVGPSPVEQVLEASTNALEAGDLVNAEAGFRQALEMEPNNLAAAAGLIQCRIKADDLEAARTLFESLRPADQEKPELAGAKAALALAEQTGGAADTSEAKAALEANPDDPQAQLDYATALMGAGQHAEAAALLLEMVRRDRSWNDEAARKQLLTLFDVVGHADPLTVEARKALSSILFS